MDKAHINMHTTIATIFFLRFLAFHTANISEEKKNMPPCFHDMAHAVVSSQDFENRLLKAFIRQWPQTDGGEQGRAA